MSESSQQERTESASPKRRRETREKGNIPRSRELTAAAVTLGGATMVGELVDGEIREYEIHPEDFGLSMFASRNLQVADAAESKEKIFEALAGKPGPVHDIVLLNAAAALYAAGKAVSIAEGIDLARATIASGAARAKLDQFVQVTRRLGGKL